MLKAASTRANYSSEIVVSAQFFSDNFTHLCNKPVQWITGYLLLQMENSKRWDNAVPKAMRRAHGWAMLRSVSFLVIHIRSSASQTRWALVKVSLVSSIDGLLQAATAFCRYSVELKCKMKFGIYLPPKADTQKCPVLYWLSGEYFDTTFERNGQCFVSVMCI